MGLFNDLNFEVSNQTRFKDLARGVGRDARGHERSLEKGAFQEEIAQIYEETVREVSHKGVGGLLSPQAAEERARRVYMEFVDSVPLVAPIDMTKCRLSKVTLEKMERERRFEEEFNKREQRWAKRNSRAWKKGLVKKRTMEKANAFRRAKAGGLNAKWNNIKAHAKRRGAELGFTKEEFYKHLRSFGKVDGKYTFDQRGFSMKIEDLEDRAQVRMNDISFFLNSVYLYSK